MDRAGALPEPIAPEALETADVVTVGCGDACPVLSGRRSLDWTCPTRGASADQVRALRDDIGDRGEQLPHELLAPPARVDGHLEDAALRVLGDLSCVRLVDLLSSDALCTSRLSR